MKLASVGSIGRVLVTAALLLSGMAIPRVAVASVIFFESAAPSGGFGSLPVYENFESITPTDTALASFSNAGITYAAVTGCGNATTCPGNVWVTGFPYPNFGIAGSTSGAILTSTGNEFFTITPSFTVRSIGFDIYTITEPGNPNSVIGANDVMVTVLTAGGPSVFDVVAPTGNFGFLGIVSDAAILQVTWQADMGGVRNTGIDNIRLSEDQLPVPEPATLLLLGSGITGLALRRRRRG